MDPRLAVNEDWKADRGLEVLPVSDVEAVQFGDGDGAGDGSGDCNYYGDGFGGGSGV